MDEAEIEVPARVQHPSHGLPGQAMQNLWKPSCVGLLGLVGSYRVSLKAQSAATAAAMAANAGVRGL